MRRTLFVLAALGVAGVAGCGGDSTLPDATGKGRVRAINTIATSPQIDFLIEERLVGSADYKSATTGREYDDLDYTFNFEVVFPTGRERVASEFVDVVADRDYTFVISGALASPTLTLWETDVRLFEESESLFEARFGHFGAALPDVDVYFAAPGITPALGQQVATITAGEISDPADYPDGEYEMILTAAGDPSTVLYTSDAISPPSRTALTFGFFEGDPNDVGPLSVQIISNLGTTSPLPDINLQPTFRFHQASMALVTADVYNDDPTTAAPILTNHSYRDITGDIPVFSGTNLLRYTPAGDTSMILIEDSITPFDGTHTNYYVVGEADAFSQIAITPDRRPVETLVKFTLLHAATNHPTVDIYIVEADTDIADVSPVFFSLPVGTPPLLNNLQAGSFDLYVTTPGEKTVIAGPLRLDVALGDVVDTIVYDNVDPATADIVIVPLP